MFLAPGSLARRRVGVPRDHVPGRDRRRPRTRRAAVAPSARLGLAYPLARRFRTAMTLAMFAVIVLTLVYMSEISYMNRGRTDEIAHNLSGGFGIDLLSNPSDPVTVAQLLAARGVTGVAPLGYVGRGVHHAPRVPARHGPRPGSMPRWSSAPPHLRRAGAIPERSAAWRAVANNPNLVIVDDFFLQTPGGPSTKAATIGDPVVMHDPLSGRSPDLPGRGHRGERLPRQRRLRRPGRAARPCSASARCRRASSSPPTVRRRPHNGCARSSSPTAPTRRPSAASWRARQSQSSGFFTLMQQFVGAGLLVGDRRRRRDHVPGGAGTPPRGRRVAVPRFPARVGRAACSCSRPASSRRSAC